MDGVLVPVLYGMTGLCAYAALHHALIAWRRPTGRTHLLFALACALVAAYVLAKTGTYHADTAQALVQWRRLETSFAAMLFMVLPWFAREYSGQQSVWPPLVLSLFMGALLVANTVLPYGLAYTGLPESTDTTLPWGERVVDLRTHPSAWYHAGGVAMLLVFVYALYGTAKQYQRGDRRRAVALAAAVGLFMTLVAFNRLVNAGIIDFMHTAEFGFLSLVFVMNQALTGEFRAIERRMQAVLDNVPAVVYLKDLEGHYLVINRQFEALFRVTNANVLGKTDYDLFPAAQANALRLSDRRALDERQPRQFEEMVDVDGHPRDFLTIKFPVWGHDEAPYAVCGVSTDMTASRQTAREVDSLRQQVWHSDRVARLGAISTSLAHELNQPLTAILSNAQAGLHFLDRADPASQEFRDILEDIVRDNKRAIAVINGLRAMLRQQRSSREPVELSDIVTGALELLKSEIVERGVECECALTDGSRVLADKVQIGEVMLNLLMNAVDALDDRPAGQRRLHVSVATDGDTQARVVVRDSGSGLPPNQLERIFETFYSTKAQGLGMGLALCRSIIESHGGRIWANDNEDQGATVQFVLPVAMER